MKKTFTYLLVLLASLSYNYTRAQSFIYVPSACYSSSSPASNSVMAVVTITSSTVNSYSWTCVGSLSTITPLSGSSGTNVTISFGACGNHTITCYGYATGNPNPIGSTATVVSVQCAPVLTITPSPSNPMICPGSPFSMSAIGAMNYTVQPGGFTTPSFTIYPTSSTCFTVFGANSPGCVGTAVTCLTMLPLPPLQVIAPTTTVCAGSSTVLAAVGANSYMWSIGMTTPFISVTPSVATCYSVVGVAANGCTAMAQGCVIPLTTCADVWPGDANSDGIVDNTDVFEIGLAFNGTGPARSPGGNTYISQFANAWTGSISTGKNKCHADCNGDGTINNGDTLAIYNNYGLTHPFKPSETSSVGDVNLVTAQTVVNGGQWSKADIVAGSAASPLNQLYGVAYDINFEKALIQTDSIYIMYTSSFLNNATQNVNFRKTLFTGEIIHSTSVRTNGTNVNGNGKIGELWFKVKTGIANNTPLNLSVSAVKKIDAAGTISTLTGGSAVLSVMNTFVGLESINSLKNAVSLFPNPASKNLSLQSSAGVEIRYAMFDITGREILKGTFTNSKNLDLSTYAAGAYMMRFESDSETLYKKLIVEK